MPSIKLSDFNIAYEQRGKGLPLLFIHGYPLSRSLWEPQLADLAADVQIIVPDLRGHGDSEPGSAPHSMQVLAKDCFDFISALGINSPILVCGLSMGGYIAMEMLRSNPEKIAGLILAATRSSADSPEAKANRDKSIQLAQEQGATPILEGMLSKLLSPKNLSSRPDLVDRARKIMSSITVPTIMKDLKGLKERSDSTQLLINSRKPTLIIHGVDDQIVPISEEQALSQLIQGSQFVSLPDAGHLLNIEQPDLFNQAVRQFIRSFPL